jgi:hypothetical protein
MFKLITGAIGKGWSLEKCNDFKDEASFCNNKKASTIMCNYSCGLPDEFHGIVQTHLVKKFPDFMEPESLSSCIQTT